VEIATVLAARSPWPVSRSPEFVPLEPSSKSPTQHEDQADIDLATRLLRINQACTSEQAAGLMREAAVHDEQTILQIVHCIIEQQRARR
jgi:AmiR/NasT family two-component response regulator